MPKAENVLKCHLASSFTSSKNAKVKPKNENQTDVVCKEGGGGRRLIVIIQKYRVVQLLKTKQNLVYDKMASKEVRGEKI